MVMLSRWEVIIIASLWRIKKVARREKLRRGNRWPRPRITCQGCIAFKGDVADGKLVDRINKQSAKAACRHLNSVGGIATTGVGNTVQNVAVSFYAVFTVNWLIGLTTTVNQAVLFDYAVVQRLYPIEVDDRYQSLTNLTTESASESTSEIYEGSSVSQEHSKYSR